MSDCWDAWNPRCWSCRYILKRNCELKQLVCEDDDVWWESKTRKMLLLPSLCQHSTLCSPSHFCLDCVLLGPGSAAYITIILHRPGEDEPRRPGEIFRPSFLIHQVRSGNIIWNGSMLWITNNLQRSWLCDALNLNKSMQCRVCIAVLEVAGNMNTSLLTYLHRSKHSSVKRDYNLSLEVLCLVYLLYLSLL